MALLCRGGSGSAQMLHCCKRDPVAVADLARAHHAQPVAPASAASASPSALPPLPPQPQAATPPLGLPPRGAPNLSAGTATAPAGSLVLFASPQVLAQPAWSAEQQSVACSQVMMC